MTAATYFYHITRNDDNNTYLLTIVVAAAALTEHEITDPEMLELLGPEEYTNDCFPNIRTHTHFLDHLERQQQD